MEQPITHPLDQVDLEAFRAELLQGEKSRLTVEKYLRDVRKFLCFLDGQAVCGKQDVLRYKEQLLRTYAVSSANSMLAAANALFSSLGWHDCRVKQFKRQKAVFCPPERLLTREEYLRLVSAAQETGDTQLSLVMQTLCSAGLRVSELRCVTVEAAAAGRAVVSCKGKSRMILLPAKLCAELSAYAGAQGIPSGCVFRTGGGRPLDRSRIWSRMNALSPRAGVAPEKIFPHNLRHLFARTFYEEARDIIRLADLLGHSSVNTTRMYTVSTGDEHARLLESLCLLAP